MNKEQMKKISNYQLKMNKGMVSTNFSSLLISNYSFSFPLLYYSLLIIHYSFSSALFYSLLITN